MLKATQTGVTKVILQKNLKDMVTLQNPLIKFTKGQLTLAKTTVQNSVTVFLFLGFPSAFSVFTIYKIKTHPLKKTDNHRNLVYSKALSLLFAFFF